LLRSIPKTVNRDVTEGGEAVETEVEEKKEVKVEVKVKVKATPCLH